MAALQQHFHPNHVKSEVTAHTQSGKWSAAARSLLFLKGWYKKLQYKRRERISRRCHQQKRVHFHVEVAFAPHNGRHIKRGLVSASMQLSPKEWVQCHSRRYCYIGADHIKWSTAAVTPRNQICRPCEGVRAITTTTTVAHKHTSDSFYISLSLLVRSAQVNAGVQQFYATDSIRPSFFRCMTHF